MSSAVLEGLLARLRPAQARVDLTRLAENYSRVAAACGVPVMPVVKADAYGHGAGPVARRLEALGAPLLAVAYPEEGAALRAAGVRSPIVVLAGFSAAQAPLLLEHQLTPVVSTPHNCDAVIAAAREAEHALEVHLEVDTGMSRLGFAPSALNGVAARLADAGHVNVVGVTTHLASADEDAGLTTEQLDRFEGAVETLRARGLRPRWIHAANTPGLAHLRPSHTLARPGLLLYGVPSRPLSPPVAVRPVMTVAARVSLVKEVGPGTGVSYGRRWVADRASRIATLPLGYADGVPRTRAMSEGGSFTIRGRRVPVAGTVCMDLTMVDVTMHPEVVEGDEAVLFGDEPTVWEVADRAGTNAWQVLTSVGPRVPRVYVEEGRIVDVESRYR